MNVNTRATISASILLTLLLAGCGGTPPAPSTLPATDGTPSTSDNGSSQTPTNQPPSGNTQGSDSDKAGVHASVEMYTKGIFHSVDTAKMESYDSSADNDLATIKAVYKPEFVAAFYDEDMPEIASKAFWGLMMLAGSFGALIPADSIEFELDVNKISFSGDRAVVPADAYSLVIMGERNDPADQEDIALIKHNGVWKIHLSAL